MLREGRKEGGREEEEGERRVKRGGEEGKEGGGGRGREGTYGAIGVREEVIFLGAERQLLAVAGFSVLHDVDGREEGRDGGREGVREGGSVTRSHA